MFKDDVEAPLDVQIELSDNQVVFRYGAAELISRTIEGNYPDYAQIIPKSAKTEVVVARGALVQAIKSTSLFSKTGLFDVHLVIDPEKGTLVSSASDSVRGANSMEVPVRGDGQKNEITLNFRYLLDGLNAMPSEEVKIKIIDGANPCLITPATEAPNEKYLYIVMPIRQ